MKSGRQSRRTKGSQYQHDYDVGDWCVSSAKCQVQSVSQWKPKADNVVAEFRMAGRYSVGRIRLVMFNQPV